MVSASSKRAAVMHLREAYRVSGRRATAVLSVSRRMTKTPNQAACDQALVRLIRQLARQHLRFGYRRLTLLVRRQGHQVNHKRVYRIYREQGLGLRRKRKRKRTYDGQMVPRAHRPNAIWAIDFMSDQLASGRRTRVLNGIDESSNLCVLADVARSFPAERVIKSLERAIAKHGKPSSRSSGNGPEFRAKALRQWAAKQGIRLIYSRPGKPTDNACVESFNAKVRSECLDLHCFSSIADANQKIAHWKQLYNHEIPQRALQRKTPAEKFAQAVV